MQAKEKFIQLKSEHEKYISEKNSKMAVAENKIRQREAVLSQKIEESQRAKKESEAQFTPEGFEVVGDEPDTN